MISFTPIDIVTRAEGLLDSTAHRLAQGPPNPDDVVNLLKAREQVNLGVHLFQTEDDLNKKILDILA